MLNPDPDPISSQASDLISAKLAPTQRNVIVIGASAGGVEALIALAKKLPSDFAAAIFITVHFPSYSTSQLPQILSRVGNLPALHPQDGDLIQPGKIYIAPPNFHLLLQAGHMRLDGGVKENGHRPAIDPFFRSAAYAYGPRVIGVILTGVLDDGTAGLQVIKEQGGVAIVQDPQEALFTGMIDSVLKQVAVDQILRLEQMAEQLQRLSQEIAVDGSVNVAKESGMPDPQNYRLSDEAQWVAQDKAAREQGEYPKAPSPLTCPDCGGVLWELQADSLIRFRCHLGHAYSLDSFVAQQSQDLEKALWSSIRALEEKASLARRMAVHAKQRNHGLSEQQFLARAEEASRHAELIRQVVVQQGSMREPEL